MLQHGRAWKHTLWVCLLSYLGRRVAKERWCIAGVVVWHWEGDRWRKNRSSFLISPAHPSVLTVASSPGARPVTTWLLDIPAYLRRRGNHHASKSASTVLTRWVTLKNFYFGMGEVWLLVKDHVASQTTKNLTRNPRCFDLDSELLLNSMEWNILYQTTSSIRPSIFY